ncbi:N-acetylmuramate alpha-1-phosphate uridylyltransferase MurU [Methylomarinum sp. Ch1-1]|uniref:N-acetylmuramate alpha-1-phosphate uridylyltransferase MurU n=1 Tax=Methylomarinum roseum TaxID=3067653 RepID=A0AAU7NT07_9GAMM|nr:nucleotidyltransferase family protein [Methylomarinum sp. Ch1-1]MDP4519882.1 nucleotidyltransferase family protein [Methylomarinum sp. Ch1-1]
MKAMILAAGRGERMRPLTDFTPKPLLPVANKPLIQYTIENLVAAGYPDIVINLAHLGQQIKDYFGNGHALGANIAYSDEGEKGLETAGGIINALPLLGKQAFLVVNGDIACDFPLSSLRRQRFDLAHLVLVDNPPHHRDGDFHLANDGHLSEQGENMLTFSGIGLYKAELFAGIVPGEYKLGPLLRRFMQDRRISGVKHHGFWMDVGTPERLKELDNHYQHRGTRHV